MSAVEGYRISLDQKDVTKGMFCVTESCMIHVCAVSVLHIHVIGILVVYM